MIIKLSQKKEQDPSRFQATSCQIHQGKNKGSNYCLRLVDERPQGRPGYFKNKQVLFQQKQIFVMSCLPSDMFGLGFCCCCFFNLILAVKVALFTSACCLVKLLSRVQLFATPGTVAHQAPQSMESSRQEYWSGLPFPSPGDLPNPGIKSGSPALQADALPSEPPGKPTKNLLLRPLQTCLLKGLSVLGQICRCLVKKSQIADKLQ